MICANRRTVLSNVNPVLIFLKYLNVIEQFYLRSLVPAFCGEKSIAEVRNYFN